MVFPLVSAPFRGGYRSANRQFVSQLPFYQLDLDVKVNEKVHSAIVKCVKTRGDIERKRVAAKTDRDREWLLQRAAAEERKIDSFVYKLYELTPDDIELVEARTDYEVS